MRRFLWKLSILLNEFGHFIALTLIAAAAFYFESPFDSFKIVQIVVIGILALFFLAPMIRAYLELPKWEAELNSKFPGAKKARLLNYWKFWYPRIRRPNVEVKALLFADHKTEKLVLDLYLPVKKSPVPLPWLVVVHGGGWDSGNRTQLKALNYYLADKGIAVAAVSYRLAPESVWPAAKNDVAHAVKFLKANSEKLGLDPTRWAILGRSAGGQLAQVVAYTKHDPTLKGCISFYAPSDMTWAYENSSEDDIIRSPSLMRAYMGGAPDTHPLYYSEASGLNYVSRDAPPTLQFHGRKDVLVSPKHAEHLKAKLDSVEVPNIYFLFPWSTHGFDFNLRGPAGQISTATILHFLNCIFSKDISPKEPVTLSE